MLLQTAIWSADNKLVASKHATRKAVVRIWVRIAANLIDDWSVKVAALGNGFHWKPATQNRTNQISARGGTKTDQTKPV